MEIKTYYYWYLNELHNSIRLNHTYDITNNKNITTYTKTYTSIADAMRNAPTFAEQINV